MNCRARAATSPAFTRQKHTLNRCQNGTQAPGNRHVVTVTECTPRTTPRGDASSWPPARGRQRADGGGRVGVDSRNVSHDGVELHLDLARAAAGRVEQRLDVVLEAHAVRQRQAAQQLVVGRAAAERAGAAGGVPGLEVGGVHAQRRQDLGDGVVHVVGVAEHGAGRQRQGLAQLVPRLGLRRQERRRRNRMMSLGQRRCLVHRLVLGLQSRLPLDRRFRPPLVVLVRVVAGVEVGDRGVPPQFQSCKVVCSGCLLLAPCTRRNIQEDQGLV